MMRGSLLLVLAGKGNDHILWLKRFRLDIMKKKWTRRVDKPATGHPESGGIQTHSSDQALGSQSHS